MQAAKVGIVGFGFIGKVHAYGYLNLPLFCDPVPLSARVTHVCTSRRETAEKGAATIGADHAVTDFRRITESDDVDIVHVCTPNHLHKDALLSAMAGGKHIYCDKPLVADWPEAEEVAAALKAYDGTAQMTLQNRFFPATMRARQLVEAGALGELLEFRGSYLHSGSADPTAPLKWKLSAAAGGGVIADLGVHVFDLLHFLLGDFEQVLAGTHIAYSQRPAPDDPARTVPVDAEDNVMSLVRMPGGALGTVGASKIATGTEDELRIEVHGSRGALRFNTMDAHRLEVYDGAAGDEPIGGDRGWRRIDTGQRYPAPAARFPSPKCRIGWMRSHVACLANFLQAVADGRPGEPGLRQGIYLQRLIDRLRVSARTGAWTRV